MKKSFIFIGLFLIVLLGIVAGGGYYVYDKVINIDTIYPGVSIDGYNVSYKSKLEALKFVKDQKEIEGQGKSMRLFSHDFQYNIHLNDIGYSYDFSKAVEEAYKVGREGNLLERYKVIKSVEKNGVKIPLESYYNKEKIKEIVSNISQEVDLESQDALFNFNNGKYYVTQEVRGRKLNKEELINFITNNIEEMKDIKLPIVSIEPTIKKETLARINGIIGEYSTSFKGSSSDRIENIRLSAKALSNKMLMPGEEMSYNNTTGPRERKYGYKEANVIIGGELTPGVGGGVCQTSTTLYNALLLSDITILERHPHSIAAAYVPKGQDGAVAYGYLDLKFRNDFDFPIYTYSKIVGDRIYFYIYGDTSAKDYTIKIESEVFETIPYNIKEQFDPKAPPGSRVEIQQGRTGYKVKTFKSIIKGGKVISKKQISLDYYREKDFIYKIGPPLPKPVYNEDEPISNDPINRDPIGGQIP